MATVLSALRYWQEEILDSGGTIAAQRFSEHFEDVEPLTHEEIDVLCEHLNIADDTEVRYQDLAGRTEAPITRETRARIEKNARLIHGAFGLVTEAGELIGAIKKHVFYGTSLDVANIKEELGDSQWYAAQVANALNFDLGEIQRENIEKLKRRYPEKFTEKAAIDRRDKWAQWKTQCPDCGHSDLMVIEATLVATGQRLRMHTSLCSDGFEVPTHEKDASTTDELVSCDNCGGTFELSQLAISSE
jgi:NTP pyrophosphatase (non-canonical NTP hydrolase)